MDQNDLLAAIFEDAPARHPQRALDLGAAAWPSMQVRPPSAEDAESCRLLSLCAAELRAWGLAAVWRRRALTRASLVGWHEAVAALLMAEAFIALSRRNEDYARGRTLDVIEGEPQALEILQELEPFMGVPSSGISVTPKSPSPALIRRFLSEKRGSFQLAMHDWSSAEESFARAVDAAEGVRGELKARGGLALARYMIALDDGSPTTAFAEETRAVRRRAEEIDEADVAGIAEHNARVMDGAGRDLLLYEIL